MFGQGLLKGLQITWREFFNKKVTILYPEQRPPLPPRFHGSFRLDAEKCIACGICAGACPNKVIKLDSVREGKKRRLTSYVMYMQYCLFCGLCVESCNQDALHFTQDFELAKYTREDLALVLAKAPAVAEAAAAGQGEGEGS